MGNAVQHQTIALSGSLTGAFKLFNTGGGVTLHVPVVTSCEMYLLAAPADNTADYHRIHRFTAETPAGGVETALAVMQIAAGSLAVAIGQNVLGGAGLLKVETSVAQAAVRSLAMITRIR